MKMFEKKNCKHFIKDAFNPQGNQGKEITMVWYRQNSFCNLPPEIKVRATNLIKFSNDVLSMRNLLKNASLRSRDFRTFEAFFAFCIGRAKIGARARNGT